MNLFNNIEEKVKDGYKLNDHYNLEIKNNKITIIYSYYPKPDEDIDEVAEESRSIERSKKNKFTIDEKQKVSRLKDRIESFNFSFLEKFGKTSDMNVRGFKNNIIPEKSLNIDVSNNINSKKIRNILVNKDNHIDNIEDLHRVKITPFTNYYCTVEFYTQEPHKYWANISNLREYAEMCSNNSNKNVEEILNKDRYICHHRILNGLDKYVEKILDKNKQEIKQADKSNEININFEELIIKQNRAEIDLDTYYSFEIENI